MTILCHASTFVNILVPLELGKCLYLGGIALKVTSLSMQGLPYTSRFSQIVATSIII